jgi:hypothetical protein
MPDICRISLYNCPSVLTSPIIKNEARYQSSSWQLYKYNSFLNGFFRKSDEYILANLFSTQIEWYNSYSSLIRDTISPHFASMNRTDVTLWIESKTARVDPAVSNLVQRWKDDL